MVMIVQPEPSTLAHYAVTAGNIPPIATQIYEGLVTYDWDQNPQPNLATSWEIAPDGKSITFKLREGVVFHNGKPFTSADVQFSFMEILKKYHPFAPLLLAELTGVDTPDEKTAVLLLANPAPYLMKALAGRDLPIMCKSVFEGTQILQNPSANKPIGTGPFKFGQWDRGQFVRLDRNDKYWKPGLPYLDHIIARFIPDAATRSAALETGEAHFAGYSAVNYADLARMKTNPILDTTMKGYEMTPALSVLELNAKHPPLDKKEVRQALSYSLNRVDLVKTAFFGVAKPITSTFYSPASLGQPDNAELIQWYNRVRAIQRRELSPVLRRLISLIMRTMRQRGLPKKWDIDWCELEHLTILQQAEARLTQARTDSLNIKSGMLYPDEPRRSRFKGKYSFDTQIDESKKAPGFMAPLPAGVLPGAMPAIGVINSLEGKMVGGAGGGAAAGAAPANANAHNVTGYTRRNPTAPALGANPPVGGDKAPSDRGDATGRGDDIATFEDLVQAAQAGQVVRTFAGLPIVIENPKGSTRNWVDSDGTAGSTKMKYDYGYVEGTCGPDGDGVDVYLGPNPDAHWVYVIHQMSKASGFQKFDEDKVMLGFDSANHARDAYLGQYDDERFFGGMSQMTVDDFKRQLITAVAGRIQQAQMDGLEEQVDEHLARLAARRARVSPPIPTSTP